MTGLEDSWDQNKPEIRWNCSNLDRVLRVGTNTRLSSVLKLCSRV